LRPTFVPLCLTRLSEAAYFLGESDRLTSIHVALRPLRLSEEFVMFIILWVVMGVLLGGVAGLLLIAGLQLSRGERGKIDSAADWTMQHSANPSPDSGR
jgi:hypothetical protein